MTDDAFTRLPDQWSPDEAIERQLAQAAESPVPPSLRQATLQRVGRQLRQARSEGTWLLAAWLLIGALVWMQLSSMLSEVASLPRQVVVQPAPEAAQSSSLQRSWHAWSRFILPID